MDTKGTTGFKLGFKKGMSKDISFSSYPTDSYYEAENFNMYLNKEGSIFNIENADGNEKKLVFNIGIIDKRLF